MKKFLFIVLLFLIISSESSQSSESQLPGDNEYELIFSDEFNQPNGSVPNKEHWTCPPRSNSGWSRWISNSPKVAFIRNGALVCRAIPNPSLATDTAKMLTGAVFTKDKFEFRYGKVEVRMKTNLRRGNFPAAWLRTWATKQQPLYSEIDIVETFGNRKSAAHTVHSELTQKNPKHKEKNVFRTPCNVTKWHVYGVEWSEEKIVWTLDGEKVGEYKKTTDQNLLAAGQWSFDYPLFIILNQSVGSGGYDFFMPQTNKTYETQFDWIRVYKKK